MKYFYICILLLVVSGFYVVAFSIESNPTQKEFKQIKKIAEKTLRVEHKKRWKQLSDDYKAKIAAARSEKSQKTQKLKKINKNDWDSFKKKYSNFQSYTESLKNLEKN